MNYAPHQELLQNILSVVYGLDNSSLLYVAKSRSKILYLYQSRLSEYRVGAWYYAESAYISNKPEDKSLYMSYHVIYCIWNGIFAWKLV